MRLVKEYGMQVRRAALVISDTKKLAMLRVVRRVRMVELVRRAATDFGVMRQLATAVFAMLDTKVWALLRTARRVCWETLVHRALLGILVRMRALISRAFGLKIINAFVLGVTNWSRVLVLSSLWYRRLLRSCRCLMWLL